MRLLVATVAVTLLAAGIAVIAGRGAGDDPGRLWGGTGAGSDGAGSRGIGHPVVHFARISASAARTCREATSAAAFPVLCPQQLPLATRQRDGLPPAPVIARILRTGSGVLGVEFGSSELHFAVLNTAAVFGGPPQGAVYLGRRTLGGASGRLYRAPPGEASGYNSNHFLFVWSRGGSRYTATLHRTFGPATVPVLGALVAQMLPASDLRPVSQPRVGAEGSRVAGPSIRIGGDVSGIAAAGASVWATSYDSNRLVRIDGVTARTKTSRHLPHLRRDIAWGPWAVAAGGNAVWVANTDDDTVIPVSEAGAANRPIRVGNGPEAVAVSRGRVWVLDRFDRTLERIGATAHESVLTTQPVGRDPTAIATGFGSVWVVDFGGRAVIRVDRSSGRQIARIPLGGWPGGIAVGFGSVWVTNFASGTLSRIDPRTGRVDAAARAGETPCGVATGMGSVWVADYRGGAVMRIDPVTMRVIEWIPAGATPLGLAVGSGSVWIADQQRGRVLRIAPGRG